MIVGAEALARFDDERTPDVWFGLAREAERTAAATLSSPLQTRIRGSAFATTVRSIS